MTVPVVVFGAAGGLGRRIVKALAGVAPVVSVDRSLDAAHDLADPSAVARLLEDLPARLTAINAAGLVASGDSAAEVAAMVRANIEVPACIATVLAPRLEHLVHVSSVSVYGAPTTNPITEAHPTVPTTVYGASKLAAEHLVSVLCARSVTPVSILRLAQLFALPSAATTYPHSLVARLAGGELPALQVALSTRRDYLHVDDAAGLVALAARTRVPGTFNVGSGTGTRLVDLEAAAYEAFGRRPPAPAAGPDTSQWLDVSLAKHTFGWQPEREIIGWIRSGASDAGAD